MTIDELLRQVMQMVRDQAGKLQASPGDFSDQPDAYTDAVNEGLALYSQVRPQMRSVAVPTNSNYRIDLSLLPDFDESFAAQTLRIEFPIIQWGEPQWMDRDEWIFYHDDNVLTIRFTTLIPPIGTLVRVHYNYPHVLPNGPDCTFPDSDSPAVVYFSAAQALQFLADEYAQASEHTVATADIALFINKSQIYSSRAVELRKLGWSYLRAGRMRAGQDVRSVRG